ncbi:MAG TPA: xanthine dehydrogenase family protein subunit M [Ktedonobacteraceae bacterium]|jgi:CO/xanthine dehydrogenase FAD-binding subunit|nr:xanthine dehydrogenase family protein subunit M [Ktedonobacteraceae bacterium]
MKPPRFRYFAPQSVEEALILLAEHTEEARVLAGGQSLVPLMNMRLAHPGVLIDINNISELAYVHSWNGGLALGAMTRDAALERDTTVAARLPLLVEAARCVGHPAIRNRSTVGGSIAHADPAAELPAVMLTLNAEFEVRSRSGSRTISARDFFKGYLATDLKADELLTELRVPGLPVSAGSAFVEFSRREGDYALAGVASVIVLDEDGTIADARLGLCSAGPAPVRPQSAEALLRGQRPGDETWAAAATAVITELNNPPSDIHGSADYRRHLAGILTRRALAIATERAGRKR